MIICWKIIKKIILIQLLFICVSCQYQFGFGDLAHQYQTISVPYVIGDEEGGLTREVIKQLSVSGALKYLPQGGELNLNIKILEVSDENIGFRYDRKKRGTLKKSIIPTETRLKVTVEVIILENSTHKVIRGPTQMSATIDFDHDYYDSRHITLSLGQLNDIDAAKEAALCPLNQILAEKIVDYVINSW